MNSSTNILCSVLPNVPGYRLSEQLYRGSRTVVYRGVQVANQQPVIVKMLLKEYPTFSELVQFRNQYTIAKDLPIAGIVQPLSLESLDSGYAIVMEDCGGIALNQYLQHQQVLSCGEVLAIALQLATILADLSQHRIIHKDIKPANILIHPDSKQVRLIDFSIASLLPKETQDSQSPITLEGTLAYLAPEQTGRMNRGIDYRTDFYALGITLYQLLTGTLPFNSEDPLELIHCHIAKQPIPIHQVNADVPETLSAIVAKLMAKNAEDRYQSAVGLKHDLESCLTELQATGAIAPFQLGERDLSDRFSIPEKLYGREKEVQTLLTAFERVAEGASELMLIAGFSGIGKTAVVNEVHKPIVRQRGYFIRGKYDQFNRNIPLSAFVQALRDLMGQLLTESAAQLAHWKSRILAAVESNGQVLIDVIPELEQIIGQQPEIPELSGNAAQNRFNLLFPKFIEVFTTHEHPLVIFLDDLQWADLASLKLMKLLMNGRGHLLILGAYRDNEVSAAHPFILTIEELKKAQKTVQTITLLPLSTVDVNRLIAETLHCSIALSQPLTELVMGKTQGNPFFLTQFLKTLYDDGLIAFNLVQRCWECDLVEVKARSLTDDIVEFMAQQLQKLPADTQDILKLAACMGNQFDLATLAIVAEQPLSQTANILWKALQEGLILPSSQIYKLFQGEVEATAAYEDISPRYRFLHDRVQQAAYTLIAEDQKQVTHLKIGRLLQLKLDSVAREEKLFDIIGHFNLAQALLDNANERQTIAELNLTAGRRAKTATAYLAAFDYFNTGIALLSATSWETQYDLTLALYSEAAAITCLSGKFEALPAITDVVFKSAKGLLDKVQIYDAQIQSDVAQSRYEAAIETGRKALRLLGMKIPQKASTAAVVFDLAITKRNMRGKQTQDLLNLPLMQDPKSLAIIQLLYSISPAAFFTNPKLQAILLFKQLSLSIRYGNTESSAVSYASYGAFLCRSSDGIESGYQFGQLAIQLHEKLHGKRLYSQVAFLVNTSIQHWKKPLHGTIAPLQESYRIGLEVGDLEYAAWSACQYIYHSYCIGVELDELETQLRQYAELIQQMRQDNIMFHLRMRRQVLANLCGQSSNPAILDGDFYSVAVDLSNQIKSNNQTNLACFYMTQLELCYRFGEFEQALENADLTKRYEESCRGLFNVANFYFYETLSCLALYPDVDPSHQKRLLKRIKRNQKQIKIWAGFCPENHQHRYEMIQAEYCQVMGDRVAAVDHYDQAIAQAKANHWNSDEALANELAAKFYLDWGKVKIAQDYLTSAFYGYTRWGAIAKLKDLQQRYPALLAEVLRQQQHSGSNSKMVVALRSLSASQPDAAGTSTSSMLSGLDSTAAIKASQALSGEIKLDRLLNKLLKIVLESAGADKCVILMPQQQEWFVEAVAIVDEPVQVESVPLSARTDLPHRLIRMVRQSLQPSLIFDTLNHPALVDEIYTMQTCPKSILCTPILHQGSLVAILYLENKITIGAFTHDRIELLNLLLSQAAISLENARLYSQVKQSTVQLQNLANNLPGVIYKFQISAQGEASFPFISVGSRVLFDADPEMIQADANVIIRLINPATLTAFQTAVQDSMQSLQPFNWVGQFNLPSGQTKRIEANSIPVQQADGSVIWDGVMLDVSDRIAAEQLIIQKSEALEQAMQELQNAQLQTVQSEKMASLGNLVAGVAHEINNPIGFLNGSIGNAKDYISDLIEHLALYQQHHPNPAVPIQDNAEEIDLEFLCEDLPKLLHSMRGATDRIKGISTSLRTFSRADTEHKVSADLHEGLDSTLLILKYRLKANETRPAIEVVQNYGDLKSVDCFPGQLNQVFMNLLANAIDVSSSP